MCLVDECSVVTVKSSFFKVGEQPTVEGKTMHDMPIAIGAGDVADAYVRSRSKA